jgi:tetrahydromethanopterin S-methyltransferase subunit A
MADDGGWRQSEEERDVVQREDRQSVREESDGGTEHGTGALDADALVDAVPDQMVQETEDDDEGAVAGSFAPDLEVTPGRPRLENVVFVALGVYVAALAVGRMFVGASMYTPETLGALTIIVIAGTALLYGFFTRTNPDT